MPGLCVRIANRSNSCKAKIDSTSTSSCNFVEGMCIASNIGCATYIIDIIIIIVGIEGEANIGTAGIIFVDSKNDSTM